MIAEIEKLSKYDPSKMVEQIDKIVEFIENSYKNTDIKFKLKTPKKFKNTIYICGMGGSIIAGHALKSYLSNTKLNIELVNEYNIPEKVTKNDLIFICSYSGNTEEIISCYEQFEKKKSKIITISSGGKLEKLSTTNKNKHIKIKKGIQPRSSIAILFFQMLTVLNNSELIKTKDTDIKKLIELLKEEDMKLEAYKIAKEIKGNIPLIYTSKRNFPIGYRFKTQINENAKCMAFNNFYSEMNHNEILGFTNLKSKYIVICIKTVNDHERILKRMDISSKIIKKCLTIKN